MKLGVILNKENGIDELLNLFFKYLKDNNITLYNEFNFQYEFVAFLRYSKNYIDIDDYKIKFERNIYKIINIDKKKLPNNLKREIDIYIYNDNEKYAIELKFPSNECNGGYPKEMVDFIKDIGFMQFCKEKGFNKTFCINIVRDSKFYLGNKINSDHIFNYFRSETKSIYPEGEDDYNFSYRIGSLLHNIFLYRKYEKNTIINWKDVLFNDSIIEDEIDKSKYYTLTF